MGTRAVIRVEGVNYAEVYKHWDGYPEATLPFLEDFNKRFTEERGDDPAYKFAQLLRDSVRQQLKFGLDASKVTGWGVNPYNSDCGQEFTYELKADGTVKIV